MGIRVVEAVTAKERKAFVRFPMDLYKGSPYFIPPLIKDELDTFDPKTNPAFDTADAKLFLAMKDGRVVGRVAAINSHIANEIFSAKNLRFGWFDSIDDYAVAEALLDAVAAYARAEGLETISGPQGFCSFDRTGMLVDGFDQLPTFITSYNHPYYGEFMTRYGFTKAEDYVEFRVGMPKDEALPPRLARIVEKVRQRGQFRIVDLRNNKDLLRWAPQVFDLFDEAYKDLPEVIPLSERQKEYYLKRFLGMLRPEHLALAVDKDDQVAGFMIAIPSLSRAFQRAKGRLFPFGFLHILRALRKNDSIDFCLAGVRKKYRGRGVDILMSAAFFENAVRCRLKHAESNPEWEGNQRIQAEWKPFDPVLHKRRRVYGLSLTDAEPPRRQA